MKKHIFTLSSISLFTISLFTVLSGCSKKAAVSEERLKEVVVYTYDSFCSDWGPGNALAQKFTEKTGLKLTLVDCGDGVQILSRAVLEKKNVQADVILGLDNNLAQKAEDSDILEPYKPAGIEAIPEQLTASLGKSNLLTPFDFAPFAMIFDTASGIQPPHKLNDLAKPEYAKKIILMNPRTSTPGLGFAAWTYSVFGDDYKGFWKALKPNILTMAPSWSAGYGLFTNGEAPLVCSYTTSAAYHYEYDKTDRYQALIFTDGHVMQVEGAGLAKNAPNKEGGKLFLDFLISEEAQNELPLTQWMIPANKNVQPPKSFLDGTPVPVKILDYDVKKVNDIIEDIMSILSE